MKTPSKTTTRCRDAGTGRFLTVAQGKRKAPDKVGRERVPKPGYGDAK